MAQTVQDIMTTNPFTMPTTATAAEASRAMRQEEIGDILIEHDGSLAGILTDRDIVVRCIAEGIDPNECRVEDILTRDLVAVEPDTDADEAVALMRSQAIRRLPVVNSGKPVGILSIGDLAVKRDEKSALADISAAPPNN